MNWVTVIVAIVMLHAVIGGILKGASHSVRELYMLVMSGVAMLVSIYMAWRLADMLSPMLHDGLMRLDLPVPQVDAGSFERTWKLLLTAIREFDIFRFSLILLLVYVILDRPMNRLALWLVRFFPFQREEDDDEETDEDGTEISESASRFSLVRWFQMVAAGFVGFIIGGWRALIIVTFLFITVALFPQAPFAEHVQQSVVYKLGADQIIEPFSGDFIKSKVPIWTEQLERQLQDIFNQKYAWLDADIPADIEQAAVAITKSYQAPDEKARALYNWVGSRITYDWDKVNRYESEGIWLEQTADDTFRTRRGVCIDYARLYAVMARSIDLNVKIVTGLGYDGRGGFGPHAWNEVQLANGQWAPLDATWHSSGKNWFNTPDFHKTHVRREVL